jgi:hypothetical protein
VELRNPYRVLVERPPGKRLLVKPKDSLEDNIKIK